MTEPDDAEQPRPIDELLDLIRLEARYLERENGVAMAAERTPAALRELPEWRHRPEPLPARTAYHVNEFLVYEDIEFVVNAFRGILRREPDESGLDTYTTLLRRRGDAVKLEIVLSLLESGEGRERGVRVLGIPWKHRYRNAWWMRKWVRTAFDIAGRRLRDGLPESSLQNETRRRADRDRVGAYLSRQSAVFDYILGRERQREAERDTLRDDVNRYRRELARARRDLAVQQQRVNLLLDKLPDAASGTDPARELAAHAADKLDAFYMAFEDECRGDEARIREQLGVHLSRLPPDGLVAAERPVLDIGSGRGEWLALLAERGIPARGVDISPVLVEYCRDKALDVTLADALVYLERQPDGAFSAITAFHLIEHLPFDRLFGLVEQCHRVLAPGGRLIFETPNPENVLVGSHTFYHDPTHRNPITPTMIEFLLRHLGFADVCIERLHPYPESARVYGDDPLTERVNGAFCGAQDFAATGGKAA